MLSKLEYLKPFQYEYLKQFWKKFGHFNEDLYLKVLEAKQKRKSHEHIRRDTKS